MSVVAWDGKTLAADRQATNGGLRYRTSKVKRLANGVVLAWVGEADRALMLVAWYESGWDKTKWPSFQSTDDWCRLIALADGRIVTWEREPVAIVVDEPFFAWGSGRELAIGAMAMGATAEQAVEIASRFEINCGLGAEVFHVERSSLERGAAKFDNGSPFPDRWGVVAVIP